MQHSFCLDHFLIRSICPDRLLRALHCQSYRVSPLRSATAFCDHGRTLDLLLEAYYNQPAGGGDRLWILSGLSPGRSYTQSLGYLPKVESLLEALSDRNPLCLQLGS